MATNQQSQITPPPELVQQWCADSRQQDRCTVIEYIATKAARWGADQELESFLLDVQTTYGKEQAKFLRSLRRPKPPSLAKRALHILGTYGDLSCAEHDTIRQALETLPND